MLTLALIAHVVLGLIGVGASYAVVMLLLRRTLSIRWLRWSSAVAFFSYILSWLSGGYYYVVYYGSAVKPVIKAGDYAWAHSVIMESKEHAFLFLPVLAFMVYLAALLFQSELESNVLFRRALIGMGIVIFVLGFLIALAGVLISGAAR